MCHQPFSRKITTLAVRNSIRPATAGCDFLLVVLALACFGLSRMAQAQLPSPTPDGGYPNDNTAEGTNALFSVTSGTDNTATGFEAIFNNTTGSFNTATGSGALQSNTTGSDNTATGGGALSGNTTGLGNTANGF